MSSTMKPSGEEYLDTPHFAPTSEMAVLIHIILTELRIPLRFSPSPSGTLLSTVLASSHSSVKKLAVTVSVLCSIEPQPDGSVRSISSISGATLDNERHYWWSILGLEIGALIWAIKRLQPYLHQIPFIILSNHTALELLARRVGEEKTRVRRRLEFPTAYPHTVEYRPGSANPNNDDFLSRFPSQLPMPTDRSPSSSLTPPPPTSRRTSSSAPLARLLQVPLNYLFQVGLPPPSFLPPQMHASTSRPGTSRTSDCPDIALIIALQIRSLPPSV